MDKKQPIAVVGASKDIEKHGYKIFHALVELGENVYAVGRSGGEIDGRKMYASLSELPEVPQVVILVVPPAATGAVVEEAIKLKIPELWFQPGTQDPRSIDLAVNNGIKAETACYMMAKGYW